MRLPSLLFLRLVPKPLGGIETHLDLERLCPGLGPEEVGLFRPSPDVDVWGPRGPVVADFPGDVFPAGGVPFLYLNLLGVGVTNGDAVLLVLKDNEPGFSVPVHGPRLVGTVRPRYPQNFAFEWGQDILPPPASVFVPHQPSFSFPAVPGLQARPMLLSPTFITVLTFITVKSRASWSTSRSGGR